MDVVGFLKDKTRIPVIGAPLFTVSYPELVLAQCKAGILGAFPALNARPEEKLDEWITMMKKELNDYKNRNPEDIVSPFAVNQICHHSNNRLEHDMEVCIKHEVPIIITSLRAPKFVVDSVHGYGGAVIHDVINIRHAKKAIDEGADGLILVCAGAGGHAGTLSPFALVREVREFFDGPIALSGSISHGASVLSAQAVGADFAYIGTRFIATKEANHCNLSDWAIALLSSTPLSADLLSWHAVSRGMSSSRVSSFKELTFSPISSYSFLLKSFSPVSLI